MKFSPKYSILASVIVALTATEVTLRLAFGFGNPVLLQADADTGYRFQPNQKIFRFGKNLEYNQYSQRSEAIAPEKPQGKLRILIAGDSVLNGGNPTDQSQTITELFETQLSASEHPAEVLNASAGSWGIGNQLGYLRKFGTFDSDAVIVQIGTHDLLQNTSTSDPVGHHPAFPAQPPLLALEEAVTRYAWPRLASIFSSSSPLTKASSVELDQQFQQNMESLKAILKLVRSQNIPVFVLFTPNREDLLPTPKIPAYKSEFFQLLDAWEVPVIDTHAAWSSLSATTVETYFRDGVHLSVSGNQAAADLLFEQLCVDRKLPTQYCSVKGIMD